MAPRLPALADADAPADARPILSAVGDALGCVPNLHRTLAHAPAALAAYASMAGALSGGALAPRLRELIALTVASANGCAYCASAHTALGKGLRLDDDALQGALEARSEDARTTAVLTFARALTERHGRVDEAIVAALREHDVSDAELVEIVAHVGMNMFTNTFNEWAGTEIDFPVVALAR